MNTDINLYKELNKIRKQVSVGEIVTLQDQLLNDGTYLHIDEQALSRSEYGELSLLFPASDETLEIIQRTKPASATVYQFALGNPGGSAMVLSLPPNMEASASYPWVITYSRDGGTTWLTSPMPTGMELPHNRYWYGGVWGNLAGTEKFVEFTYDNYNYPATGSFATDVAVSTDGFNWTRYKMPDGVAAVQQICYGNIGGSGIVTTIGYWQPYCCYSYDGINWATTTLPEAMNVQAIVFGNIAGTGDPIFLATPYHSSFFLRSTDGKNWTRIAMPFLYWSHCGYYNGNFYAVPTSVDVLYVSPDGLTWTTVDLPIEARWFEILSGADHMVITSTNSDDAITSVDGVTWYRQKMPNDTNYYSIYDPYNEKFIFYETAYTRFYNGVVNNSQNPYIFLPVIPNKFIRVK